VATRLQPPANDAPVAVDGKQHSAAWAAHFQEVSDILAGLGVGVADSSDAKPGEVGEYFTSSLDVGSAIALGSFTPVNIATITLPAGDWDVWGTVVFLPGAITTVNTIQAWLNTASAAIPGDLTQGGYLSLRAQFLTGQPQAVPAGRMRFSTSADTPIFLTASAGFGVAGMTAFGAIFARRMR
jgi:hypothetical protein